MHGASNDQFWPGEHSDASRRAGCLEIGNPLGDNRWDEKVGLQLDALSITFTANMQTCLIGMEACSGAHFLGRVLREQGHDVKLIPAQFVKPFVKSNKNDFLDAEAISEAVERQNMRFVPIKTDDQLDLQAMHRVRDRLVARRTSVINQLRAFLLERGMVFAKTPFKLKQAMPEILENADTNLTPRMRNLVSLLWSDWKDLEQQIVAMNLEVEQIASSDPACQIRHPRPICKTDARAIKAPASSGHRDL